MTPKFVIRGNVIELSDNDDGANDSPTAQLAQATPVIKRGNL